MDIYNDLSGGSLPDDPYNSFLPLKNPCSGDINVFSFVESAKKDLPREGFEPDYTLDGLNKNIELHRLDEEQLDLIWQTRITKIATAMYEKTKKEEEDWFRRLHLEEEEKAKLIELDRREQLDIYKNDILSTLSFPERRLMELYGNEDYSDYNLQNLKPIWSCKHLQLLDKFIHSNKNFDEESLTIKYITKHNQVIQLSNVSDFRQILLLTWIHDDNIKKIYFNNYSRNNDELYSILEVSEGYYVFYHYIGVNVEDISDDGELVAEMEIVYSTNLKYLFDFIDSSERLEIITNILDKCHPGWYEDEEEKKKNYMNQKTIIIFIIIVRMNNKIKLVMYLKIIIKL